MLYLQMKLPRNRVLFPSIRSFNRTAHRLNGYRCIGKVYCAICRITEAAFMSLLKLKTIKRYQQLLWALRDSKQSRGGNWLVSTNSGRDKSAIWDGSLEPRQTQGNFD